MFSSSLSLVALLGPILVSGVNPFEDMIVFGDSYSDIGNLPVPGPYPPFTNLFSSRKLAVQFLAENLGLPEQKPVKFLPDPSQADPTANNFAYAGARIDARGSSNPIHLDSQLNMWLGLNQGTSDANHLYNFFVGGNDAIQTQNFLQDQVGTGLELPPMTKRGKKKAKSESDTGGKKAKKGAERGGKKNRERRGLESRQEEMDEFEKYYRGHNQLSWDSLDDAQNVQQHRSLYDDSEDITEFEKYSKLYYLYDWDSLDVVQEAYERMLNASYILQDSINVILQTGGKYILVINIPTVEDLPGTQLAARRLFQSAETEFDKIYSASLPRIGTDMANFFNEQVQIRLKQLVDDDVLIVTYDAFSFERETRETFDGNVRDPCVFFFSTGQNLVPNPDCDYTSPLPLGFYHWDELHLTTSVHDLLGDSVAEIVEESFVH